MLQEAAGGATGVVACGRAGTWEGGLNTRRWLQRHLMGEKTSELMSGSLSFYLPRAQGHFTDEKNCKQISKALELLVVCLLVTCLPTVLVTCPWLFVLLQRAILCFVAKGNTLCFVAKGTFKGSLF